MAVDKQLAGISWGAWGSMPPEGPPWGLPGIMTHHDRLAANHKGHFFTYKVKSHLIAGSRTLIVITSYEDFKLPVQLGQCISAGIEVILVEYKVPDDDYGILRRNYSIPFSYHVTVHLFGGSKGSITITNYVKMAEMVI